MTIYDQKERDANNAAARSYVKGVVDMVVHVLQAHGHEVERSPLRVDRIDGTLVWTEFKPINRGTGWRTQYENTAHLTIGNYGSRKQYRERKKESLAQTADRFADVILEHWENEKASERAFEQQHAEHQDYMAWLEDIEGAYNLANTFMFEKRTATDVALKINRLSREEAEGLLRHLITHYPHLVPLKEEAS